MAIPVGTTSRQLGSLARWLLVVAIAMTTALWWWPSFMNFGAAIAGLLAVWVLWMLLQIARGSHAGAGNPLNVVPLVLSAFIIWHIFPLKTPHADSSVGVDLSMMTGLGFLALGMLLCQSLLSEAARLRGIVAVIGLCMMLPPVVGGWFERFHLLHRCW